MTSNSKIAILLATYNGEAYIAQQLNSLYHQDFKDWHLYVHDDGSTDRTVEILKEYSAKHDNITILEYPPMGNAKDNFLSILERVDAEYYMFCDQDDIWLPGKIKNSLIGMEAAEKHLTGQPVVLCTDLTVVDKELRTIHKSFNELENIHPEFVTSFNDYCATHVATGCTMMFNKKAKDVTPIPAPAARMHDAWVALATVAAGGRVLCIPDQTVLYRQHGDNTLGAHDLRNVSMLERLQNIKSSYNDNMAHLRMMRALKPVSIIDYIKSKQKYRKNIKALAEKK